jgi:hypothetical protein
MKLNLNSIKGVATIVALSLLISLAGCKGDSAPTISAQDDVKAKLTASAWKIGTVTVDGVDKTSVYPNLTLTFTSTSFTTTNGGVVWPASGTWSFTGTDATSVTRNDGMVITIDEATATSLKLGLTWNKTTIGPGRAESVSGKHVFSFGK